MSGSRSSHWASLRREKGLSQVAVANYLGITRHMIIRLEQGLFTEPGHVSELAALYDVTESELEESYRLYIQERREWYRARYDSFRFRVKGYTGLKHPLVYYRDSQNLSQIGFCKGLCLHPDPIRDYEMNKQRGIPEQLILACNAIAWDYGPLENAVTEWRISGRADAYKKITQVQT